MVMVSMMLPAMMPLMVFLALDYLDVRLRGEVLDGRLGFREGGREGEGCDYQYEVKFLHANMLINV